MLGNNIAVIFWDGEELNEVSAAQLQATLGGITNSKNDDVCGQVILLPVFAWNRVV